MIPVHRENLPCHVMIIPKCDFLLSFNNSQHRLLHAPPTTISVPLLLPLSSPRSCFACSLPPVVSSLTCGRSCCHHGEPWGQPVRPPARPPRGPAAAATTTSVCARPAFSGRGCAACGVGEGGLAEVCDVSFFGLLLFCFWAFLACVRVLGEGGYGRGVYGWMGRARHGTW